MLFIQSLPPIMLALALSKGTKAAIAIGTAANHWNGALLTTLSSISIQFYIPLFQENKALTSPAAY